MHPLKTNMRYIFGVRRYLAPLTLAIGLAVQTTACEGLFGSTKVGQGQLFTAGEARYDAYFNAVHERQVAAAGWPDDQKASRKALVSNLALVPNASTSTLLSAITDKSRGLGGQGVRVEWAGDDPHVVAATGARSDATFFKAVEDTLRSDRDRGARLLVTARELEELAHQGEGLQPQVNATFKAQGPDKQREVRLELSSAIDALKSLAANARRNARDVESFTVDVQEALNTASGSHKKPSSPALPSVPGSKKEPERPPEAKPEKPEAKPEKPEAKPASKPASSSKPADPLPPPKPPKDKPAGSEEVFSP